MRGKLPIAEFNCVFLKTVNYRTDNTAGLYIFPDTYRLLFNGYVNPVLFGLFLCKGIQVLHNQIRHADLVVNDFGNVGFFSVYDCNDFAVTVNQIISTLYFRDAGSYQEVYTVCGVKTIIVHNKTAGLRFFPFRPVPLSREETFNNISDDNIPQNRTPVNRQNK